MTECLGPKSALVGQARLLARDRSERASSGLAVFEGVRLGEEALAAGLVVEYVLYSDQLTQRERGAALLSALQGAGIRAYRCTPEALDRAADTETPQGVVGVFQPRTWSLDDIGEGLVIVLENLQDPGNMGTVIRSLEGLGGAGAAVVGGVDPYNPKVVRGAMGSLFRLPVVKGEIGPVLRGLQQRGWRIYTADAHGPLLPWTADLRGRAAVVIGNEGAGPSDEARSLSGGVIRIPMEGRTESLNASVAASLLVYESLRQRS